jgi:predicted transcriptional regulator
VSTTDKPLSLDEAVYPVPSEPEVDVRAWQDRKIKKGIADADAGRFGR